MREQSNQNTQTNQAAIGVIHDAGGHLVLCRRDKSPIWNGWQRQRPALDVCLAYDGKLGIIPQSIGTSALDVDSGDWRNMPHPWANYGTRRKAGRHLYYADDVPRGNSKWAALGCSGEVRGASGYVILWRDGLERIAAAISGPGQLSLFPFPDDLIERPEPGQLIQFPERPLNPYRSLDLERVPGGPGVRGARHDSLFDVVRLRAYQEIEAYRRERGADLAGWLKLIHSYTDDNNRRFRVPLLASSVRSTSYSVATWVWSRYYDHTPGKQRERQVKWAEAMREKNRDRAIAASGETNAVLAERYGLSVRWIRNIRNGVSG